jgi:hypothetical protein
MPAQCGNEGGGVASKVPAGGERNAMSRRAEQLCDELKMLAERLGLRVREEALLREVGYHPRSGTCRVRGEEVLFVDRTLPAGDRLEVLLHELRHRDLQGVYVSPALRRLLESRGSDQQPEAADRTEAGEGGA